MRWLRQHVPVLSWLPAYKAKNLRGDLSAGLVVAVMLIPQGMAYAMLAGLPPTVGLYASVLPLLLYAVLGTSRQLAVGPVAIISLLVGAAVGEIATPETTEYVHYAVLLALLVGVMQFLMGALRVGALVKFLSHPVVSGFTSAASLIIGFSQLKGLLGVDLSRSHHVHRVLIEAIQRLREVNAPTVVMGALSMGALVVAKKKKPTFPGALVVCVLGALSVWGLSLNREGIHIVGDVPAGFSAMAWPSFDFEAIRTLFTTAILISFVGFMESVAVAKAMAARHRYEIDANQELIALGVANVGGALLGAYPVTGGFSRTAVNDQAGARTPLASIVTASVVALTLLFLTPLFYYLPVCVLSAIIVVAVYSLVDVREFLRLVRVKPTDAGLLALTFISTLVLGIELGILVGVGASLLLFILRTTKPHTAVLGRLPGTLSVYRNVRRFPDAERVPGLLIVRVDATFYFANMDFLREHLERIEREAAEPVGGVIIDASSINDLDSSAATALEEIARKYRDRSVTLYFASVKGPVRDVMKRSGLTDFLGEDAFTFTIDEAVKRFEARNAA